MSEKKVCIILLVLVVLCAAAFAVYHFREPLKRLIKGNSTTTPTPDLDNPQTLASIATTGASLVKLTSSAPTNKDKSLLADRSLPSESAAVHQPAAERSSNRPAKFLRKRSASVLVN